WFSGSLRAWVGPSSTWLWAKIRGQPRLVTQAHFAHTQANMALGQAALGLGPVALDTQYAILKINSPRDARGYFMKDLTLKHVITVVEKCDCYLQFSISCTCLPSYYPSLNFFFHGLLFATCAKIPFPLRVDFKNTFIGNNIFIGFHEAELKIRIKSNSEEDNNGAKKKKKKKKKDIIHPQPV
ncbi:hypothetical protein VP01_6108g1, partial [Puccinia sorghi]